MSSQAKLKGQARQHDAADHHVQGSAPYLDDLPEYADQLHAALGLSEVAHAKVGALDLGKVRASPGVVAVADAGSVPGDANIGPVLRDEDVFGGERIEFAGQVMFAVAAKTRHQARVAAKKARFKLRELKPILSIEDALKKQSYIIPKRDLPEYRHNWDPARFKRCAHVLEGAQLSGAQEHFYLEGQAALAVPLENDGMLVHSSTQHPSGVQETVAGVLGRPLSSVEIRVRRMGGGFGGKETQAAQTAAITALLARQAGRPVKLRLPRAEDFITTGKRHPFLGKYKVGFSARGRIEAIDLLLASDCGISTDLSLAVMNRAIFHVDNAYYLRNVRIRGFPCKTNKVSNTAFRGFGGPQGMLLIERVIEDIARHLGKDPLSVREVNFYSAKVRQKTPYGQPVEGGVAAKLVAKLAKTSRYGTRRKKIASFNQKSLHIKRGISLTPVKFGLSFNVGFMNQAGALVNIHQDGTVALNHGGTEMGQGLFVKMAQVAADSFGLPLAKVHCEATSTAKIPNTSATAGSVSADLNGKATEAACATLRGRLAKVAAKLAGCKASQVSFAKGKVAAPKRRWRFEELVTQAYLERVQLSATGYYKTPDIFFDQAKKSGSPFYYYAYGAAVTEVAIDVLTGEYRLLAVDILHDVGRSLNPAIDVGQIEGGYAQGYGWLCCEEMSWDKQGRPLTIGPATYKIPTAGDMPEHFKVALWPHSNPKATIFRSKAVGEPPLMLAISAITALADAVAAARAKPGDQIRLDAPATPERVLLAITA